MSSEEASGVKHLSTSSFSRLRQEREERGWTQSEVAERIGSTRVNIVRWENGKTIPNPYYRQRLAELFGRSIHELGFIPQSSQEQNEETPPSSIWNVPYPRNPFFTGREEILTHLDTVLRSRKAAALTQAQAISGLGGIGKTQAAVEYAYRHSKDYQFILWMDVSTREALNDYLLRLAALLELPEQHLPEQHLSVRDTVIRQAVQRWLAENTHWLLILDNVEDPTLIADFLPMKDIGAVLLTTRLQALGSIAQSVEVEKMELDEGVIFLLRRTKLIAPEVLLQQVTKEDREWATEIVKTLDGLPLALDQAGAYIEETRCGLLGYLRLYGTRRKDLLLRRGRFPLDHPASVAATWSLSFQQVGQESPAAAELLYLLAFLNPAAIPKEIITEGATELGPVLGAAASDPLQFDEMLEVLLRYSLIGRTPEAESESLSIHRLVQTVLKDGMGKDTSRVWAERAIRAVNRVFPDVEPFPDVELQTWEKSEERCQRCLPHVQMCATHSDDHALAFPEAARLFTEAAFYLVIHARHQQAESLLLKALAMRQKMVGANHLDTARTLNDLGEVYRYQSKFQEAESLLMQALEIRQKILGKEHLDVAQTVFHLADLYRTGGNYGEAEQHYSLALHTREKVLPPDDPRVAESYYGLARLYYSQEKYQRAENYCEQALHIQEQRLGSDHPVIASILAMLAMIYQRQNKLDQAEKTNKRALEIRDRTSSADHPNVATILNSLVEIYHSQGKYDEAKLLIARALKIHEQTLGPKHPFIAYSFSSLAENFFLQGDYVQAEACYTRALIIREQHLGLDHPHTASTYYRLAEFYTTLERFEEAELFSSKALSVRERAFEVDHPAFASALEQEITLLRKLERESEICELEARVQAIRVARATRKSP